jgi:hypothetical protein
MMIKQSLRAFTALFLLYTCAYSADSSKEALKQALVPLPATCYPETLQEPVFDIPHHLYTGCNVLHSHAADKRLTESQRLAYTRAIAAVQKTFHYGQDLVGTITYRKTTPLNKSLSFAVSQIWKALSGTIEHEPFGLPSMTTQKIYHMRDALDLLVRSMAPINKVISPERKRQELRTYTGVTSPVKVNLFAKIPQRTLDSGKAFTIVCNFSIEVDDSEQFVAHQIPALSSTQAPTRPSRVSSVITLDDFVQHDMPLEIEASSGSSSHTSSSSSSSVRPTAKRVQRSVPTKKKPALVAGQTFMTRFLEQPQVTTLDGNVVDLGSDMDTDSSPSKRSRQA